MALLISPDVAQACGLPLEASIPAEQALLTYRDGIQQIVTTVQLDVDGERAAVLFPVPGTPTADVLPDDTLWRYLEQVTAPEVRREPVYVWAEAETMAGAPAGGVTLLGREILAGYDVARLATDDPGALLAWLDQHDFTMPEAAAPVVAQYVAEGWSFVAVKLARASDGDLTPLVLTFASDRIVYPMRLGALAPTPMDVQIYVLAEGRVEIRGLDTLYAGPVSGLDAPPPSELAPLFATAPYLTRLRNPTVLPANLTEDFVAVRSASDAPYRRVRVVREPIAIGTYVTWLSAVLVATSLAISAAVLLRRRMHHVAGGDDEARADALRILVNRCDTSWYDWHR